MRSTVWFLIAALVLLHQDFWFWNDATLVFGFLPIALAYHMGLSVAAAVVWYLATLYAWPLDEDASDGASPSGPSSRRAP